MDDVYELNQFTTNDYSIICGDCIQVMKELPAGSVDFIIYSPPFDDLYTYSSSIHDLGNNVDYETFLEHYTFVVPETGKLLKPGRLVAVHCMDIPRPTGLIDFPGDIIRLHQANGFVYWDRKNIWKEPLRVAIRSRDRKLMHQQIARDSTKTRGALADYVLFFKKKGENVIPVSHEYGLTEYIGDFDLFSEKDKEEYEFLLKKYENHGTDDQTNKLSQWIWRRYASSDWRDINAKRMLEYKEAKEEDDERHVCPLHLDIIERSIILYSNPGEIVFTPFMGIGSEVAGALNLDRKGIGVELKRSYFLQAKKNIDRMLAQKISKKGQRTLFQ